MIRRATIDDMPVMKTMLTQFWETSGLLDQLGLAVDEDAVEDFFINIIADPKGCVLAAVDGSEIYGGIIGIVGPWVFNKSTIVLTELGWFVHPDSREKHPGAGSFLFRDLVKWGKENGATMITVSSTTRKESEMVAEFYRGRGYVQTDCLFMGRI